MFVRYWFRVYLPSTFFLSGIGFGLMYLPSIVMVGYYFDKKRSLATGITVCGSSTGIFVLAPLASNLVEQFTWIGTNIILGGLILNGIVMGALYRPLPDPVSTKSSSSLLLFLCLYGCKNSEDRKPLLKTLCRVIMISLYSY